MLRVRIEHLGHQALNFTQALGLAGLFLLRTLHRALTPPFNIHLVIQQIHFIGARSLTFILVSGGFIGMVVALQFYDTLVRFGSVGLLGSAVGLSIIRELGPVLTALMVTGRAGSAMCAEIGIMRTQEQIDGLECMAIDPYAYLMAPRLIAGMIAIPLLTIIFAVIGIVGGWFVGVIQFGVSEGSYFQGMYESVLFSDLRMGFIKSLCFSLLIIWIACVRGFLIHLGPNGHLGAEGVSRCTTQAVVITFIAILASDYLLSAVLM